MNRILQWIKAVIANSRPYATMAQVDIKKEAQSLFNEQKRKQNGQQTLESEDNT